MGRRAQVWWTVKEKREILKEGIKSRNVSETCRRHSIAPTLFYRKKDEAEQGAKAACATMKDEIGKLRTLVE